MTNPAAPAMWILPVQSRSQSDAIQTQPSSTSVCPGSTATFTCTGDDSPTYQWYNSGGAISGATSSTYVTGVAGSYYCIATWAGVGSITSNTATLDTLHYRAGIHHSACERECLFPQHPHIQYCGYERLDVSVVQLVRQHQRRDVNHVCDRNRRQLLLYSKGQQRQSLVHDAVQYRDSYCDIGRAGNHHSTDCSDGLLSATLQRSRLPPVEVR